MLEVICSLCQTKHNFVNLGLAKRHGWVSFCYKVREKYNGMREGELTGVCPSCKKVEGKLCKLHSKQYYSSGADLLRDFRQGKVFSVEAPGSPHDGVLSSRNSLLAAGFREFVCLSKEGAEIARVKYVIPSSA